MFERFSESARRVIFFARYEASQLGIAYIDTEHLLLGLIREGEKLPSQLLPSHSDIESLRKQLESRTATGEKTSTSADLPLSHDLGADG